MTTNIEIRMNRGRAIFMASYIIIVLAAINVFAVMTTTYRENPVFTIIVVALNLVMAFNLFRLIKIIVENKPVITLTPGQIITSYRGVTTVHEWSAIKELSIDTSSRYRHILIDSGNGPVKTDISGLEKTPEEIEILVNKYSRKAV